MTIRITREQYAKDLTRVIRPEPLDIDPIEYSNYKKLLKMRFMTYIPSEYKHPKYITIVNNIFDELIAMTPQFTRAEVEEAVKRIITL